MKKTLLIISAASLLLASCAKEQLVDERSYSGPVTVVGATFESLTEDGTTKASVSDAGVFTWQNGDKAAFAESSSSTSYCFGTNNVAGAIAQFAIEGSHTFTNSSLAIYPDDLTTDQVPTTLKVKVPASRVWVNEQTNVAMYGKYETASSSFSFSHMGGLVRVRVKNVPTNAREFVFKASGCKINGEFSVNTVSESKVIETVASDNEDEQTYTLTWTTAPAAENTMDFYIPLPLGTYSGGFAFYLKDEGHNVLYSKVGSTTQSIARKKLLLMPAITLVGGSIEPIEKAAVVANIPAGYSGDFLLPQSEKVLLKINASTKDHNITLKYDGANIPTNLEVKVVDGDNAGNYNAKLLGNLPSTHVEFTQGHIDATELTTSSSTFAVINPATVGTLTVMGGNVLLQGATVTSIVVDENAVASEETQAPVQIEMQKYTPTGGTEQTPAVSEKITANADVVVAPESGVDVKVAAAENVKVAKDGEGTVNDKNDQPITTKAAAKIGEVKYITLADAIVAVQNDQTITMLCDVDKANGISVPSGKNFTVDFANYKYLTEKPGAGSANTKTQAFQLLENSTITFKNGTIGCTEENKNYTWSSSDAVKGVAMIIQNYANLTLENMTIDATNIAHNGTPGSARYAISNNCGTVEFKGSTTIKAPVAGDYAFDVCKYATQNHDYPAPTVTWNSTGKVTGGIELTGGEFVVAEPLELTQPIRTKDAAAKLTVNANITPADGYSSDALVIVKRKADLTIDGLAKISNDSKNVYCAVKMTEPADATDKTNWAKLTVKGQVTLEGQQAGISGNGNEGRGNTEVTIEGSATIKGCATTGDECCGIYQPQNGKLTIKGGTIEGLVGVYVKSGTVETAVSGGTIKGTGAKGTYSPKGDGFTNTGDAIVFDNCGYPGGDPHATINGGTFISTNGNAVASYAKEGKTPITGFINGGTFSDLSGLKYVADNATYTLGANVDNAAGMSLDTKKTFTVDFGGHTYTVNKPGAGSTNTQTQAFQLIAGQNITFKNGTIKAADANLNATSEGAVKPIKRFIQNYAHLTLTNMAFDGTNINGENSVVEFCNGNVTIDGTTNFTAKSGVASINVDSWKGSYPNGTAVTINTTGNVGKIHCYTEGTGSMTIKSKLTIKNGKNITLDDVSNGEVVISIEGGEFTDMSGVNKVADNGTYKLASDVNLGENILEINSGKAFSIDLNGKTLTGRTNIKHGNVTFKNGNIAGGNKQALNVYGSSESTATNYSVVTVDSDVTVTADVFGVCLFGPAAGATVGYGAGIIVRGKVNATKTTSSKEGAVFVSGNLGNGQEVGIQTAMEASNTVNISGTVTSASDAALALNGSATATVTGKLTGNTGIAAKRGKLIVQGNAEITGNGACVGNPAANGNGPELTGSAVSASSTYGQRLTIDLQGGTYTSAAYTILNNAVDNACTFNISGGKYESTKSGDGIAVYARLGSVNITGGEFINNSNSEATLHVGCPSADLSNGPKLTISGNDTVVKNNASGDYTYGGKPLVVNMANQLTYKAVEISGGKFYYRNPSKDDNVVEPNGNFLKDGFSVSGDETNGWTVSANQN